MARKKAAKAGSERDSAKAPLLEHDLQRELLALALLALALFLLLTLVPVTAMGERIARIFPAGNAIGPVGGAVAAALWRALGVSAVLVPPLLVLGGLRAGD